MRIKIWLGMLTILTATGLASPTVQGAGLLIADGGFGGRLEIVEQDVHVTINNGIAVTHIDQVFLNTENRIVEALYTFPVPHGASISNFTMMIDGKEMIGEVVEKQRARQIYESYKTKRRDPGLLEQVDYKTFELRVFPIAAKAEQRISITYYQRLNFDHNQATYVYPLATTTRGGLDATTRGKFAFTIDVKSEIPILKLFSPSHRDDFAVFSATPKYTRASLELPAGDLSRDVVISYDTERPHTGFDLITSKLPNEDGTFMMTMTAGAELAEVADGMDYMFVVDISGSMANDGKLTMSRTAVSSFVSALGQTDRFDVMTFNSQPVLRFGELRRVDGATQSEAQAFLLEQRAKGGTALRPAIQTAYKYKDADRPLNVVVLSDGLTEISEQAELLAAIQDAPQGTRVFCIGIGNDTNRPLLKQLAESAGGLAAFISHQDDFSRQAQAFRRKLMRPVATNVQIAIDGVEVSGIPNGSLPDLFYGSPIHMMGRYNSSGIAQVNVTAEVLGQPFTQSFDVEFPAENGDNPEIDRMWAYDQVQRISDEIRVNGPSDSRIGEIVDLCEGYSIVSEYASFIVLENDAEYARWSIQRRNLARTGRDRAAQARLRLELERLREESLAKIGPPDATALVAANFQANPSQHNASGKDPSSTKGSAPERSSTSARSVPDNNSRDFDFSPSFGGNGRGGGAIDPITGLLAAGAAGATALAARRKKRRLE